MKRISAGVLAAAIALAAGPAAAQSLWNPDRPSPSLFSDTTARLPGDVLTVVINERQLIKNKEDTELKKSTTLDAAMPNTGTSSAVGVNTAAEWRASSQFQMPKPNSVLPSDCHSTVPSLVE